jgi:hypothetical protein
MSFMLLGILNSQAAGGGGAGAYDLLETTTLTSSATGISFSGLDSYAADYKHLQIRMVARDTGAGTYQNFGVRMNSDTGNNYADHIVFGRGNTAPDIIANFNQSLSIGGFYADGGSTSGAFGAAIIDILDFSSSSKKKVFRTLSGVHTGGTSRGGSLGSGLWIYVDPITNINIFAKSTSFAAGSRFSLIGIK